MPALNYKAFLVDKVVSGEKPHTFRKMRKRRFRVGDVLSHFTGPRMHPRRIRSNTVCLAAPITTINPVSRTVYFAQPSHYYKEGYLSAADLKVFAQRDGFESADEMFQFFQETHGGLVCGQLVEWNPHAAVSGVFKPGAHQEETALGAAAVVAAATSGAHDTGAK